MRALVRSAIACAVTVFLALPVVAPGQTLDDVLRPGANTGQTIPGTDPRQDLLRRILEEQLRQRLEQNPPVTNDPTTPPSRTPPTQTRPADRQAPVIVPIRTEFQSRSRTALVRARITDNVGVARAVAISGGTRQGMRASDGTVYEVQVPLASHYRPVEVTLQAWDGANNASAPVRVAVRRVPYCGSVEGVTADIVRSVQRNLALLGYYNGGIDGLTGPQTCRAIAEAGLGESFLWPEIDKRLGELAGQRLIALEARAPSQAVADSTRVTVRIIDPGNTDRVAWVRMQIGGAGVVDKFAFGASEVSFDISTPEGISRQITFLALDRSKQTTLARDSIALARPEALGLRLTASGLSAGQLQSEDGRVSLLADVTGAREGRVFYDNPGAAERGVQDYTGVPVRFIVTMPPPGETWTLTFRAESGDRRTQPTRVILRRLWVFSPRVWFDDIVLEPVPLADPAPERPGLILPPTGLPPVPAPLTPQAPDQVVATVPEIPVLPVTPKDGLLPGPVAMKLLPWLIGLMLLLGAIILLAQRLGRRSTDTPDMLPTIHVVAVPDESPEVEVTGAELPGLVLRVEPGLPGKADVIFEDQMEGADP